MGLETHDDCVVWHLFGKDFSAARWSPKNSPDDGFSGIALILIRFIVEVSLVLCALCELPSIHPSMARRKKSSVNPLVIVGLIAAVALAIGGYVMFSGKGPDTFSGTPKLDPGEYLANAMSIQGNTYQVTATVNEQIKATETGRLYSMTAKSEKGGAAEDLAVLFPEEFAKETIQKGTEMTLKVEVVRSGLLKVTELKRS
jgi:hypothetical protein